jgi:hypothetical protein
MRFLSLSVMAMMFALPHAAAQDDPSDTPDTAPSAVSATSTVSPTSTAPPVETITDKPSPAEGQSSGGVQNTAGEGGQRGALRSQIEQIDRAEREELRRTAQKYEGDRRAILEKYRAQRKPLEQERAQLQPRDRQLSAPQRPSSGATQAKPIAAGAANQKPRVSVDHRDGDRHDEDWRRRERERRAREADWRRRHPPVIGQGGPVKPGAANATATSATAPAATAPAGTRH